MYNECMRIESNNYMSVVEVKKVEPIIEIRQQDIQMKPMSPPTAVGLNAVMTHNVLQNIPTQEIMKLMAQTS